MGPKRAPCEVFAVHVITQRTLPLQPTTVVVVTLFASILAS